MKFYLIVTKGKKKGFPIPIEVDLFMIGQTKECQLRAAHEQVGEQHCALVARDKKVFIRDMGSGQATVVNGEVMTISEEWPLHAGDTLGIGPMQFMIQYREKALSQRDLEEWALKCLDHDESHRISALDQVDFASRISGAKDASGAAAAILDQLNAKKGVVRGRLRISRDEGVVICRINDVYLVEEAELNLLKRELHDNMNRPNLKVLIDMKNVKRMSSAAAEMFGELRQWLRPFGSVLAFCRLRQDITDMMMSFPATSTIRIFENKDAAIKGKW